MRELRLCICAMSIIAAVGSAKKDTPIGERKQLFGERHEQRVRFDALALHKCAEPPMQVGDRGVKDLAHVNLLRVLGAHKIADVVRRHAAVRNRNRVVGQICNRVAPARAVSDMALNELTASSHSPAVRNVERFARLQQHDAAVGERDFRRVCLANIDWKEKMQAGARERALRNVLVAPNRFEIGERRARRKEHDALHAAHLHNRRVARVAVQRGERARLANVHATEAGA